MSVGRSFRRSTKSHFGWVKNKSVETGTFSFYTWLNPCERGRERGGNYNSVMSPDALVKKRKNTDQC